MTSITATRSVPRRRHALAAVLLGALFALPGQAQTTQGIPVTEIKPLLALAAERGAAHGVLTGPGADYVRRRFDAATPIEIDVATLHALPQPGCARLEVTTRQRLAGAGQQAAIRAAQIGCDLKVPGATAFFSWPSFGRVAAYMSDEAAIEASESAIAEFLVDFAANCGAEKLHVIAHSMGNRGLLRALQRISARAATHGRLRFGQIVLAAPDLDRGLFLDLVNLYGGHSARTTLYTSDGDKAVHLSAFLHGSPRAGYFTPYTVAPGVDTVAVPDFDLDLLGHGYFAQAAALLHDIYSLMHHDMAPRLRQRLSAARHEDAEFWRLAR